MCAADKLATTLYPWGFYELLARLSGELDDYLDLANAHGFVGREGRAWFRWLQADWRTLAYRQAAAVPGPLWPGGPPLPETDLQRLWVSSNTKEAGQGAAAAGTGP